MAEQTLEDFLKPISEGLGHTTVPEHVQAPETTIASTLKDAPQNELVKHFEDEARKVGSMVVHSKKGSLGPALVSILSQFGCKSVLCADDDRIDQERIPTILKVAKVTCTKWNAKNPKDSREVSAKVDAGVTFPLAGVAETGSVLQQSDKNCGRSISLLPLTYIAVVNASDIVPSVHDALDKVQKTYGSDLPSTMTFITGPSTTSDIELVRVIGVHGPMNTAVVIVDDQ